MTYHELRLKTIRAAQNLQEMGFQSRQVFSFMVNQCDDLLPLFLASTCLACPIVPLHSMLSKEEIVRIFAKTKPCVIFCDTNHLNMISQAIKESQLNKVKVFVVGESIDDFESIQDLFVETGDENHFV